YRPVVRVLRRICGRRPRVPLFGRLRRSHYADHAAIAALDRVPFVLLGMAQSRARDLRAEGHRGIFHFASRRLGSAVAIDTEVILHVLAVPHELVGALAWRI